MDPIKLRQAQSLDDFLVGIARCVEVLDDDIAGRVDEREIQQRQELVVLEAGLEKEGFNVRKRGGHRRWITTNGEPSGVTGLPPNGLLSDDRRVRDKNEALLVECRQTVATDGEVFRGYLTVGGVVGRRRTPERPHEIPSL